MIQLEKLHKTFAGKTVLSAISATFEKGKVYGVVGQNGAGKTTLFRCIAGLTEYQGSIKSDLMPLKHHLGYLPTESYYLPKITAEEYIFLMTEARGRKVDDLPSRNIFDLPLKQYVDTFSTGMKKKLAITAVLLQGNDYFIFDEPYNGLDLQSSFVFTEIVRKLKSQGKTILIASHIFATLSDCCDEILWLSEGVFKQQVHQHDFLLLEQMLKEQILNQDINQLFV
ncbi:ABC transporter ATP-binding protein [Sphingobacterium sp. MYb382]|uniref:ABC transporter ATP-binding protein n=1 Tax=Sphingobacterium sp. MYb382 TaxID=2745278 RepID=UPI0030AEA6FC